MVAVAKYFLYNQRIGATTRKGETMKTTQLGIDSTGQWTAFQYVIDAGYDRYACECTAEMGCVSDEEAEELTDEQQAALVAMCRRRADERYTINCRRIQHDPSGAGHTWRDVYSLPADIREEIAAEIIDGKQETCGDYVASNGQHYRW
jgi:hypothetical protein